jgi:hypothetical protein
MLTIPKQTGESTFLCSCIQLYEQMMAEIKSIKGSIANEEERIQLCFEVASNYKEKIKESVRSYQFSNQADEIFFFKKVKPLFNAEAEYYTYRYHTVLFKTKDPDADANELSDFYKRQLLRKEKFKREFQVFYEYITNEATYADKQWFTRHSHSRDSSLFDGLMGRYLAIEKFETYVRGIISKGI